MVVINCSEYVRGKLTEGKRKLYLTIIKKFFKLVN